MSRWPHLGRGMEKLPLDLDFISSGLKTLPWLDQQKVSVTWLGRGGEGGDSRPFRTRPQQPLSVYLDDRWAG